jgi:class 3 adenylate cyclase
MLVVVPKIAGAAANMFELGPGTSQLTLSLLLAVAVVPSHRRLRPKLERLFFPERHELERGTDALLADLSRCREPGELFRRTGEGLEALVNPETCAIYARAATAFGIVFARGRMVPPAYDADGTLIAVLESIQTPLVPKTWQRRQRRHGTYWAALESVGAAVLLPIYHGDALTAFVCLGIKRSGDIYTASDLALLMAVANAVSRELVRFAEAELLAQAQQLQHALRRYVPGAVATQLESGAALPPGEREVTVLFVDIRGYTTFSEGRRAEDIFSAVNRYTGLVSEIVRGHGGSVVEFNGDGMMAVFGAPIALAAKERAAVDSGWAICRAMSEQQDTLASVPLSVGVGIATGMAFVGNIHAVDRLIWTAIGNTTNLAARLQALTRDLDAAMVVDRSTWLAAGAIEQGVVCHEQVSIRGRQQAEDVYAWPLEMLKRR